MKSKHNLRLFAVWAVIIGLIGSVFAYSQFNVTCTSKIIPYVTVVNQNPNETIGTTKVLTEGVDGTQKICKRSSGKITSDDTIPRPVDKIVSEGTKPVSTVAAPVYSPESSLSISEQSDNCPITTCRDGSCSSSTGRGTCSWHGGVDHYN